MTTENTTGPRYPEIDLLRTLAIMGMVVYHFVFMAWYIDGWTVDPMSPEWRLLARTTSNTFLFLVGVSFVLASKNKQTEAAIWKRAIKRSITVLCAAFLVTIVTIIFDPAEYIRFGILHCIGFSMLLLPLFRKLREGNILLGILVLVIGFQFYLLPIKSELFLPLGLITEDFSTLDFFPIIPWSGIILIGAGVGSFLYERLKLKPLLEQKEWYWVTFPGRYALPIYLIHPVIIYLGLKLTS